MVSLNVVQSEQRIQRKGERANGQTDGERKRGGGFVGVCGDADQDIHSLHLPLGRPRTRDTLD